MPRLGGKADSRALKHNRVKVLLTTQIKTLRMKRVGCEWRVYCDVTHLLTEVVYGSCVAWLQLRVAVPLLQPDWLRR